MSATIDKIKLLVEVGDLLSSREIGSQEWRTLGDAWLVIAKANQIETTPIGPDIEAISARYDAGTPGPWRWWDSNSHRRLSSDATGKDGDVAYGCTHSDGVTDIVASGEDMAILAGCRSDVPTLILEVRRLTAAGNDLRALVEAREAEIEQFRRALKVAEDKIAAVDARLAAMQARMPL